MGRAILFLIFCLIVWKIRLKISSIEMLYCASFFNAVACMCMIGIGFREQSKATVLYLVVCLARILKVLLIVERIPMRTITANLVTSAYQSLVESFRYSLGLAGRALGALLSRRSVDNLHNFRGLLLLLIITNFSFIWKIRKTLSDPKLVIF